MTLPHNESTEEQLLQLKASAQRAASQFSLARSKHTSVGAAVLSKTGEIHSGSFIAGKTASSTVHAEAAAITHSLLHGDGLLVALALFSSRASRTYPLSPCGACLQFLAEHASGPQLAIITSTASTLPKWEIMRLEDLLPQPWPGWT